MKLELTNREELIKTLKIYVSDEYQTKHAFMVAHALEFYSANVSDLPEDLQQNKSDLYFATGLLHDIDYQEFPSTHPTESLKWFEEWGLPSELIHAVEAHAYGFNGFTTLPKTHLAACLMSCDELSGFLYAYALMRPTGFIGMDAKSVKKRLKDKSFAAKINRDDIYRGVEYLKIDLDLHIANLIQVHSTNKF